MDRLNRRPNPSAESMLLWAEAETAANASVGAGNTNGQFKLSYDLHRLSCRDEAPSSRRTALDRPLRILGGAVGAAASGGEVVEAVLRRQRWRDSPYLAEEGAGDF